MKSRSWFCRHSTSLRVCVTEQQKSCSNICSQWVKHVVQHSSREATTEQIIMIRNIVTSWNRATPRPSVLCPWTVGLLVHLCARVCVSAIILDFNHTLYICLDSFLSFYSHMHLQSLLLQENMRCKSETKCKILLILLLLKSFYFELK